MPLDKRQVGLSFGRAAQGYDAVAGLQRQVGNHLLESLPAGEAPTLSIDVGAGTGYCTRRLMERFPSGVLLALDLAEGMLHTLRRDMDAGGRFALLCSDAENLPVRTEVADLVFSNLALQWCQNVAAAFGEFHRILRPAGLLVFSTFGPATLRELRAAWARVDHHGHVLEFPSPEELEVSMKIAGFRDVTVRSVTTVLRYASVEVLMRELKELGAHNLRGDRPRHLTGKKKMRAMIEAYEPDGVEGKIPASFEIVYAYARRV